jgi:hypothetical protein
LRDENEHWQIRNSAGAKAFLDANGASSIERIPPHQAAKVQNTLPHNIAVRRNFQLGAPDRMTVLVLAAFVVIPAMDKHHSGGIQIWIS